MDSSLKDLTHHFATHREHRTSSLPHTPDYNSSPLRSIQTPSKNVILRPIESKVGILKNGITPLNIPTTLPSPITQSQTAREPRVYSRQIKISSSRGTTVYNLQRNEDGSLVEFKPVRGVMGDIPVPIKEVKRRTTHLRTASTGTMIPATSIPGTASGSRASINLDIPKTDFFRIVNQALNDQQRQLLEEKQKLMQEQEWFSEEKQQGKSKLKVPITKIKRRLSNDLKALKPEEREIILQYEHEIIGNYTASENRPRVISSRMQKKLEYLEKLRQSLVKEGDREFVIKMVRAKKNIREWLMEKELKKVMAEFNQVLNLVIEYDDMYLFLETLQIISDLYYDFGEMSNALFAFNQLRIACELCNNVNKKIIAYMGMSEACKRLGLLNQALVILKRALQFAWYLNNPSKECQLYDLLGIIYYTQREIETANYYHERCVNSDIEGETSPLCKISKLDIEDYIENFHTKLTSIEPTFFTRMSLTYRPRRLKAFNVKLNKEKLRTLLHSEGRMEKDNKDNYFENEAKLTKASNFIEKLLIKANQHQSSGFYSNEPSREIGTQVSATHQLDAIFAEPDFEKHVTSPRTFYRKQQAENQAKASKIPVQIEKSPEVKALHKNFDRYLVRKQQISDSHYQELKRDKNKYSLKTIFKERELTFKNIEDRVELRLHQTNSMLSFGDVKKQFQAQYTANPVNSKMFMGHLTPNRTTYGFLNVIEVKFSRLNAYFDDALEYFVNKNNPTTKSGKGAK